MSFLKTFYKKTIKYDLLNKFIYKKTINIPKLKKIDLNFAAKTSKLIDLASNLLALEIIASKKSNLTKTKKANPVLKLRKGNPVGCKVTIKKNLMFNFLEYNIINIMPQLKYSNNLKSLNIKINKNTLSYNIKNLFIFNELEKNYYLFNDLKKLDVVVLINSKKLKEISFITNSIKMTLSNKISMHI